MSEITIRVDEIEKIDFLDGFRGTLAIWVLMMHSTYALKVNKYFRGTGSYIGVPCFFILSSFLLTYRLLNQFNNDKNSYKDNILIIIKYFIRRFFRIYIPFVIFAALIKGVPSIRFAGRNHSYFGSFFNLISLKSINSYLWTIVSLF
jgi:peptidoglycan/LPS O-acetylase OafA/YrhL